MPTKLLDMNDDCLDNLFSKLDSNKGLWIREAAGKEDIISLILTCRTMLERYRSLRLGSLVFRRFQQCNHHLPPFPRHLGVSRQNVYQLEALRRIKLSGRALKSITCENDTYENAHYDEILTTLTQTGSRLQKIHFMHPICDETIFDTLVSSNRSTLKHLGVFLETDVVARAIVKANLPSLTSLSLYLSPPPHGIVRGATGRVSLDSFDGLQPNLTTGGIQNMLASVSGQLETFELRMSSSEATNNLVEAFRGFGNLNSSLRNLTVGLPRGKKIRKFTWITGLIYILRKKLREVKIDAILQADPVTDYAPQNGHEDELNLLMQLNGADSSDYSADPDPALWCGPLSEHFAAMVTTLCPLLEKVDLLNFSNKNDDDAKAINVFRSKVRKFVPLASMSFEGIEAMSLHCAYLEEIKIEFGRNLTPTPEIFSAIEKLVTASIGSIQSFILRRFDDQRVAWNNALVNWIIPMCGYVETCLDAHGHCNESHSKIWVFQQVAVIFQQYKLLKPNQKKLHTLVLDIAMRLDDFAELLSIVGGTVRELCVNNVPLASSEPLYRALRDYESSHTTDKQNAYDVVVESCTSLEELHVMTPHAKNLQRGSIGAGVCCHNNCGLGCALRMVYMRKKVKNALPHVAPLYRGNFPSGHIYSDILGWE